MGRQAYITRLALGRSPYEAPVLTDSGEFILGPYAHEFDNTDGYIQQYNERGHPEFRASRAAARELRRAKNDVLSTVGVVYKMAEPARSKKNDGKLVKLAQSENEAGFILSSVDNLAMFCSLRWLTCLRMRVQAFESYSLPLTEIMKSELRTLGAMKFLFAGLPVCLVSSVLTSWRKYWMSERIKGWLEDFGNQWIFDTAFYLLYATIETFGALQGLHLISPAQPINLKTLVLVMCQSSIPTSNLFIRVLGSPIVLLSIYTSLNQNLQAMLWYVIRSIIPKPDRPDRISCLALEPIEDAEAKVPGLRDRPWTLCDEVRFQYIKLMFTLEDIINRVFGSDQPADESSHHHADSTTPFPPTQRDEPNSELASTATPDPADLFDTQYISQEPNSQPIGSSPPPHPLSRANTLVTPLNQSPATTPPASPRVRASLIHRDSETVTMQLELLESEREVEIDHDHNHNHNHSEEQHQHQHQPQPQSIYALAEDEYAPTISSEDQDRDSNQLLNSHDSNHIPTQPPSTTTTLPATAADTDTAFAPAVADTITHRRQHHHARPSHPQPRHHRVTALSNFPSDALASHLACLITTAARLPLEALFVRSLARSYGAQNVRPAWRWWDWRYTGSLVLVLGMQGLVSSVVWSVGTGVAVGLGRGWFGWGRL